MKEKYKLIREYLKKKKQSIIVDLNISNYEKSNFYIALLYDIKLMKYKVLFVPLDIIDDDNIDDYFCYQFIGLNLVDYIFEILEDNEKYYKDKIIRNKLNKNINSYCIEINTYLSNKEYKFLATQFIPKEWEFFFEIIVILFEHCPNIVNSLCEDLLRVLNKQDSFIPYQISEEFDLYNDDIDKILPYSGNLSLDDVTYLEIVNNKYFAIVADSIVVVEYTSKNILNMYCDKDKYEDYFYVVVDAIRKKNFKKFSKLMMVDEKEQCDAKYYLCYGILNNSFRVIHGCYEKLIPISMYDDGLVRIIEDENNILEEIKNY